MVKILALFQDETLAEEASELGKSIWAKIYRVGILMYGKKASYKELFKWLKY